MLLVALFVLAYLIGSIPTGYLICRYCFNIDVTQHGSGNIGATNVARVLGKGIKYFVFIFLIDAAKAYLSLYAANYFFVHNLLINAAQVQNYILLLACAVLLGNAHSIFLKFKGGKGVATSLGIIVYLIPVSLVLLFLASWLIILAFTRRVFMASIGATIIMTGMYGYLYFTGNNLLFYFLIIICYWLILRHRANIKLFLHSH
ncbi:MAG: glycerol-3-phosphate acyltransferase [bacterium]